MKKTISYLNLLKFDPKLLTSWWAHYLTQIRLVLLLVLAIVAIGIFGYINLPRRLNPEINLAIVVINTILPGASPDEMESLVTVPLEDKLTSLEDVDTMVSTSGESSSTITIQFKSGVDGDRARDKAQSLVDATTLPTDANDPSVIKLDFENQPVWNFAILSKSDYPSLMRFSESLKKRIENLTMVDRVTLSGLDTQTIDVVIQPEKVRELGLNPVVLSQAISKAASSYPAGSVKANASSFALTIEKDIVTLDDIRNLRITVAEKVISLGDVAAVGYRSIPNQPITYYTSRSVAKQPAVQFFVYKTSSANIDAAEKQVKVEVEKALQETPQFSVVNIQNSAEEITKQFDELTRDFISTIILVFILLLVFLGIRQAIISSITVPLTFLSTFAIINAMGLSLNFLTMFAFLIALGLLIDDTIVSVAAMTRYYATGKFTPAQTGILVWRDFIVPLWSTTITTIWAFVPLLLATGIIGEFIKSLPIVVTATMISSTTIAVLVTLPLMIVFLKPIFPRRVKILLYILGGLSLLIPPLLFLPRNQLLPIILLVYVILLLVILRVRGALVSSFRNVFTRSVYLQKAPRFLGRLSNKGLIDIEPLSHRYMRVIDRILISRHGKRNVLIGIAVFAVVAYLLVPLGLIKNEFFPKVDADLLFVTVDLPAGTTVDKASLEALDLAEKIKNTEHLDFIIAESGKGFNGNEGRSNSSNSILLTLHLTDHKTRHITSQTIAEKLRADLKNYHKGRLTIQELSGGPPAGADIQVTLLGDDSGVLDIYANKIVAFLEIQSGVTNVNKSIKPGISKLVFVPNKEKLASNNLTTDAVALWLRTYASGFTLDKIKFEGEEREVILRLYDDAPTPEELSVITIPNTKGENIPLADLGNVILASNPTVITREDKKRTISVTAALVQGANLQDKTTTLEKYVKDELKLPQGYSTKSGGVNEENQKSVNSIMQAMLVSMLLILITMVIEFRSFRQTFIALMIIPLSIAGVLYVFALTNTPLSFPALIGVLALFGIVVTHAIVVIEKINDNLHAGLPLRDAIVDAAGNRLEPVLLTSLATIVGLIPITLSDPLWRGLGGAIIAGLLFSGAIKLFFVPVMYYLMFKNERK